MKVSLSTYDISGPDFVALARDAESAGMHSLWLGEHVVLPVGYGSDHPTTGSSGHQQHGRPIIDPDTTLTDPLVMLGAAGAATQRILLGTAIYLAPLRHPLITARAAVTIDSLASGRLLLGLGAGWLREEFDALDIPFGDRGGRLDETIDVLHQAFAGKPFGHHGEHYRFDLVQVCATPVDVPIIVGGNSRPALRRAASVGDGWFASGTPNFDECVAARDELNELAERAGREPIPIWVRIPRGQLDELASYERAGFDHVVVWSDELWPADAPPDERSDRFRTAVAELGLEPADG